MSLGQTLKSNTISSQTARERHFESERVRIFLEIAHDIQVNGFQAPLNYKVAPYQEGDNDYKISGKEIRRWKRTAKTEQLVFKFEYKRWLTVYPGVTWWDRFKAFVA